MQEGQVKMVQKCCHLGANRDAGLGRLRPKLKVLPSAGELRSLQLSLPTLRLISPPTGVRSRLEANSLAFRLAKF